MRLDQREATQWGIPSIGEFSLLLSRCGKALFLMRFTAVFNAFLVSLLLACSSTSIENR
jgi:hypothetical protein